MMSYLRRLLCGSDVSEALADVQAEEAEAARALMDRLRIAEGQAREQAGEAYKARADLNEALAANAALVEQLAEACRERDDTWSRFENRGEMLRWIAAQETPGANATVKRMARIAREAQE